MSYSSFFLSTLDVVFSGFDKVVPTVKMEIIKSTSPSPSIYLSRVSDPSTGNPLFSPHGWACAKEQIVEKPLTALI